MERLTFFRSPVLTLYYSLCYIGQGLTQGTRWFISHPITLFLLLPLLAAYAVAKSLHYAPRTVEEIEVGAEWGWKRTGGSARLLCVRVVLGFWSEMVRGSSKVSTVGRKGLLQ